MKTRPIHRLWLLVVAALWFATSTHALARSTTLMLSNLGDSSHPALLTASDHVGHGADGSHTNVVVVTVDAATFWASVEEYDCAGDCKASCASLVVALPSSAVLQASLPVPDILPTSRAADSRSFIPSIDTPPPRRF